jgi:hypothetical protein
VFERKVYATEVRDRDDLSSRTEVAAADIRKLPRQLATVRGSIRRRCEMCVQEEGGNFEYLL